MLRQTIYYSGHVQGVGFRFITRQIASGHEVTGFVRNLDDGRVQLVLEGQAQEIEVVLDRIREKMQGYLHDVAVETGDATGEFAAFEIRR